MKCQTETSRLRFAAGCRWNGTKRPGRMGLAFRTEGQGAHESACYAIAMWITHECHTIGIRPPSVAERFRICGIA